MALTEAVTRLGDRAEAVSDEVWNAARRHDGDGEFASLVLAIAAINLWNRVNAATRQISGEWTAQLVAV